VSKLRKVVRRVQWLNSTVDELECGHDYQDFDNRRPKRRHCVKCSPFALAIASVSQPHICAKEESRHE